MRATHPLLSILLTGALTSCLPRWFVEVSVPQPSASPSPQRGRQLLLNRSYLKVGVPLGVRRALYPLPLETDDGPVLLGGRDFLNDLLPTGYTGRMLGENVAAATENCLLCHAGALRGQVVMGLGNSFLDARVPLDADLVDAKALSSLNVSPAEREVLDTWQRHQAAVLPYSSAQTLGGIAALYFTGYFFSHRSAQTLEWTDSAAFPMLETPPPETDIPAWWLLKKKKCLYYGCELKGDFTRSLMQFMTVPGNSGQDIRQAERDFQDVLAYLMALKAPAFPGRIHERVAQAGRAVFNERCAGCHGEYGENASYPNRVVKLAKIGTDPARSRFMHELGFAQHFNRSWFGEHSQLEATDGYLAPPLDGIWATAPYLHNGSVPTLDAVIDPSLRPRFFIRANDSTLYDLERVGWQVRTLDHGRAEEPDAAVRKEIFDTRLWGKGNAGHDFGARLSPDERRAVLEYLKTL